MISLSNIFVQNILENQVRYLLCCSPFPPGEKSKIYLSFTFTFGSYFAHFVEVDTHMTLVFADDVPLD